MPTTKKIAHPEESKQRPQRSYLQLKVNVSETTPTGAVIIDALRTNDPEFLKKYGLGPKVTRANKLLWLAYLGITQGQMPGRERFPPETTNISEVSVKETNSIPEAPHKETKIVQEALPKETVPEAPPKETKIVPEASNLLPTLEELVPKAEFTMTKATNEDEEDDLDEDALMASLMD